MAKATKVQLSTLQALTGRPWAGGLTANEAERLIAEYDNAVDEYGEDIAREVMQELQMEQEDEQPDGSDGEDSGDGDGQAVQAEEQEQEQKQAEQVEREQHGSSLDDEIIRVVKSRRDEVLDGIEFGGKVSRVKVESPAFPDGKDMGLQHKQFPTLIRLLSMPNPRPIMLVGPAGSSKTSSAKAAAEALGLAFFATSNSAGDMPSDKFGFNNANGEFVDRALTRSIRGASLFLDDEYDATNPRIGVKMNMLIDNRYAEIGGEMVKAHDDWRYIASANTFGYGADRVYVGRNQLDASTLNRFLVLEWDYDRDLESAIAPHEAWCEYVWKVRDCVSEHSMRYVVGTRQIINGGELIEAGFDWDDAKTMTLFPGWKADDVARVEAQVGK